MIELASERLHIRHITADDLTLVLPVHLSNPAFLQHVEGSEGKVGLYDLERWQRDWAMAQLMPGRHLLACYLKANNEAVGIIEYFEDVEEDGTPWLGVLIIHKAYQRQGFGSEVFHSLIEHFRGDVGWSLLRTGVMKQNTPGIAFVHSLGFQFIEERLHHFPGGVQVFQVFERGL